MDVVRSPAGDVLKDLLHGAALQDVRGVVSRRGALRLRRVPRPARGDLRLRGDSRGGDAGDHCRAPAESLAVSRAADCGKPADGVSTPAERRSSGLTASRGGWAWRNCSSRTTRSTIRRSYKDRVVSVAATRAIELGFTVSLRVDRQPGQQRLVARGAPRPRVLRLHSRQPRAGQSARIRDLPAAHHRCRRQLRRREPAVHADRRPARLGLRQHQPADLLRRGREDVWAGDCRAAGVAISRHVVCPVAGGTLLPRIARAFEELSLLGWVEGERPRMHAVQAAGSSPVINALDAGAGVSRAVKPQTVAKSIAIGNPADGHHVLEAVRASGGSGARVTTSRFCPPPSCSRKRKAFHGACRRRDARGRDPADRERDHSAG